MTQKELTDFGRTQVQKAVTDGGQTTDEGTLEEEHYNPEIPSVTDAWEGEILDASWGYDATNVNFAQIIEVSDTGKTVVCQLVPATIESTDSKASESVKASGDPYGDTFRLYVREGSGRPVFRGSYPYIDGDKDSGTRRDGFTRVKNPETTTRHQTPSNYV